MDKISMSNVLVCLLLSSFSGALANKFFTALYVFGDSILSPGNEPAGYTIAETWPYGIDLFFNSSDRLTNGLTNSDYIARCLGYEFSPASYAYYYIMSRNTTDGFNYACRHCGILDSTGVEYFKRRWSMSKQVQLFNETINNFLTKELVTEEYLSNAMYLIGIGRDDYLLDYFKKQEQDPEASRPFADRVVTQLGICLETLYQLGARKFVVSDIAPLGCWPQFKKASLTCAEGPNAVVRIYNEKLAAKLQELNSKLPNATFILFKTYDMEYDMFINPSKYGLKDTINPCCPITTNGTCVLGLQPCPNRNVTFFFDSLHPTSSVYKRVGFSCFNGTGVCDPTIEQLAMKR